LLAAALCCLALLACPKRQTGVQGISGPQRWVVNSGAAFSARFTGQDWNSGRFSWGDTIGPWLAIGAGDTSFSGSHAWPAIGSYPVKAQLLDKSGALSEWSDSLLAVIDSGPVLLANIPVGAGPRALLYNPGSDMVFCASAEGNSISVIGGDSDRVAETQTGVSLPWAMALDATDSKVYVALAGSDRVMVLSGYGNQVLAEIPTGRGPIAFVWNPSGNKVYCANGQDSTVTVISCVTDSVLRTVATGYEPQCFARNPDLNRVYCGVAVMDTFPNRIAVIDGTTDEILGFIRVDGAPLALAYDSVSHKLFCAGSSGTLTVIDGMTHAVLDSPCVGVQPVALEIDYVHSNLYVANQGGPGVTIVSTATNQVVKQVLVGSQPVDLHCDADVVYCANSGSENMSLIDAASLEEIGRVTTGARPWAMCRNTLNGKLYIANRNGASVSVLRAP
jgi:YVTN family beta-propeller protein